MRRIDLASSIQAVGHVVGDRIVCSSLGTGPDDLRIGPPDLVQPSGVELRVDVEFPFAKGQTFIVLTRDGFAAIVHKTLPLDATTQASDVSLGLLSRLGPSILASRGFVRTEWVADLGEATEQTFVDGNHIVAVATSKRYHIAAIAAEPSPTSARAPGRRRWSSS